MEKQPMQGGQMGGQQKQQVGSMQGQLYETAPAVEAMENFNHNLIQCLNEKLDSVWRYEKYIQDSPHDPCRKIYEQMLNDDKRHVQMLREEISRHCQQNMFK